MTVFCGLTVDWFGGVNVNQTNYNTPWSSPVDIAWESQSGRLCLFASMVAAFSNTYNLAWAYYAPGAGWTQCTSASSVGCNSLASRVAAYPDPYSNKIIVMTNTDRGYTEDFEWAGGAGYSWSQQIVNTGGYGNYVGGGLITDYVNPNYTGFGNTTKYEPSAFCFDLDVVAPTSTITFPVANSFYNNQSNTISSFSGTYSDSSTLNSTDFSGVSLVQVRLKRTDLNGNTSWWYNNSGNWQWSYSVNPSNAWFNSTLFPSSWSYTVGGSTFTDRQTYYMDEQAEDRAQNWQTLQTGASFYWMVYAPTATISVPATNSTFASTSTAISVGGSANDDGWNGTGVGRRVPGGYSQRSGQGY